MLAVVTTGVLYARSLLAEDEVSSLFKRDGSSTKESPAAVLTFLLLFVVNFVILFPLFIATNYTFTYIFPTLAIVEDEDTAAYNPIALDDEDVAPAAPVASGQKKSGAMPLHGVHRGQTEPVTSSLRGTFRTFTANGGWRDMFRGLAPHSIYNILMGLFIRAFMTVFSSFTISIALLVGSFVLAPLSTAWVHIVMTERSGRPFWQRLPPYKSTLKATAAPLTLRWLAIMISSVAPLVLMRMLNMPLPGFTREGDMTIPDATDASFAWKGPVVMIVSALCGLLEIPALIILIRVQASLLPEDENTVVPFDRTFGGVVSPTFEGGNGFATVKEAWASFTRASWVRLIVLYFKVVLVNFAFVFFFMAFIGVQVFAFQSIFGPK